MPINFSQYIDLTPFDEEPASIYADALDYARLVLPELVIRRGTPEDAILQACSLLTALNTSAINRLPNRLMAGIMALLGLPVDEGTRAVIDVEFTAFTYEGAIIPAGTVLRYDYDFIDPPISAYFETIEPLSIAEVDPMDPLPTGIVEARCVDVGVLAPIATDSPMSVETTNTNIASVTFQSIVTDGANVESDAEYLDRAARYLSSLSSAFCRASQIESYIEATYKEITRVKVFDLTDSNENSPYGPEFSNLTPATGNITIYVYGSGENASNSLKTEILADVTDRTVAGLAIGILDVVPAELSITIDAGYLASYEEADVEDAIIQAVTNAISIEQAPFDEMLRKSYVYSELAVLESLAYISSITFVSEDSNSSVNLDGDVEFSLKGTLPYITEANVTVNLTSVV